MRTYIYLVLLAIVAVSCHKDSEFENKNVTSTHTPEVLGEELGSVTGLVYDESNNPVANAQVQMYSGNTITDERGVFRFSNVKLDPHGTYITIQKEGYIMGSDKIFPAGGTAYSSTQLIALRQDQSFQSAAGGKIEAKNGGFVTFPPNSIVKENGEAFDGTVYVTAHFLAAEDDNIGDLMPGDLMADDELGRTVILGTAGMMAVELRSSNNEELNLKAGSKAKMEFPYTNSEFPDEIDLWSFDEVKGRWQAEGQAIREGDYYVAEVSHFSFWNCDVPFPLINLCGRVVREDGTPVRTRITISTESFSTRHGYSDSNGSFCGKVPKDAELKIQVKDLFCSTIATTVIKGGFSSDVVLDDIVIDDLLPNVAGEVQCQSEKYDNSTVLLRSQSRTFVINEINDGGFDVNLNTLCSNITTLNVIGYDNETNQASDEQTVDLSNPSYHELEVCLSPCQFEGVLGYECGDEEITVTVDNGTGTYSFLWNDGSTDNFVTLVNNNKSYCVTITEDLSGCTKEYCKEAATGEISLSLSVDECYGDIRGFVTNGVAPYEITSDHGFTTTSNFVNFLDFQINPGEYCYDVRDKNGCTTRACITSDFLGFTPYISSFPFRCEKNIYFYDGYFDWGTVIDIFGNSYDIDPFEPQVNVLETGYALQSAIVSFNVCQEQFDIKLPFFRGLQPSEVRNTSCDMCEDGQITINVNPDEECFECEYGYVRVYDETLEDVTQQNDAGALTKGLYYVAAIDSVTTCFIAHEEVEIE